MEQIKVLIADDHRVVREGLAAILKSKEDIQVIGEAQDGLEAVEKARSLLPDVILMDVSMPKMGGVEATRQIKREFPHMGIVALTMYEEQHYIFDLVRAGATGYLLKDTDSAQIVAGIRAIYRGESLIHPSVASKILALSARQMPRAWETRYGCRPLLLETLVDAARFRGTCYRAANWIHIGQTTGRGRMDREHTAHGQAIKDIYVFPLVRDARQRLCGS